MTAGETWRRWRADLELQGGASFVGRECERTAPEVPQQASEGVPSTFRQLSVAVALWLVESRQGGVLTVCLAGGSLVQGVVPKDVNATALSDVEPSSVRELLQAQLENTLGEAPFPQKL